LRARRRAVCGDVREKRSKSLANAGISIILPLFAIMVAGYLAGRFRVLPESASTVLGRFVFVLAMPALIFVSLSRIPVSEFFNWPFLGALGGGMLLTFGIGLAVARLAFPDSLTAIGLHGLTAMFSSTAYIGLPLILTLFGDSAVVPGIIGAVITSLVFAPIAIVIAEIDRGRTGKPEILRPLIAVFTRPPILATIAGLAASASGMDIPAPLVTFFELLGGAFVPCALLAAGLFIAGCSVEGATTEIGWLVVAKLVIHPVITWWLAYHVFALEGILPAIAVIQAALPSGVPVFVLAQHYKTFQSRSSAAIVVSTALSVLTLTGLLVFLRP
jgi:malonate transporter